MEGLLVAFPELQLQTGKGTVLCTLSGHEMPGRPELIKAYVEGRKFKTLKAEKDYNFQRLQPYIIPSRRRRRQLFCALTNRYLNRRPAEVDLHLRGKRYKRALEKYNAGLVSLFEEKLGKKQTMRFVEEVEDQMEVDGEGGERGEEGGGGGERGEEGGKGEREEWEDKGQDDTGLDPATPPLNTKEAVPRAKKRRPVTTLHSPLPTKQLRSKVRKRTGGKALATPSL